MNFNDKLEMTENKARQVLDEIAELRVESERQMSMVKAWILVREGVGKNNHFRKRLHNCIMTKLTAGLILDEHNPVSVMQHEVANMTADAILDSMFGISADEVAEIKPEKDLREFRVVPNNPAYHVFESVLTESGYRASINAGVFMRLYRMLISKIGIEVTPYEVSTVPYEESTRRTRQKWVDFTRTMVNWGNLNSDLRLQAERISKEIERSLTHGRPFNAATDTFVTK